MHCIDCKYAKPIKRAFTAGEEFAYPGLYDCENEHFKLGYGVSLDELDPGDIWVEDDEGWGFRVTAKFGCIHFEKR
jgi:hypothetical protein